VDVGPVELLIVLAVVLLLFGSKKVPDLARAMGQASREFKKGLHLGAEDEHSESPPTTTDDATTPSKPTGDSTA
jgi:sec-independent protein translocase protein TatA